MNNTLQNEGAVVIRLDGKGADLIPLIMASRDDNPDFKSGISEPAGAFGKVRSASEQYSAIIMLLWQAIRPSIQKVVGKPVFWFPDGYCYRDKKLGGEKAHRDQAPDGMYASWMANSISNFTFVPGSHKTVSGAQSGFVPVETNQATKTIVAAPGDVMLFCPRLIHTVAAVNYAKCPQHRVFFGVSTERPSPAFVKKMCEGRYVGSPSGEKQRAYPRLWDVNHPHLAVAHALMMNPHCVEYREVNDKAADKIRKHGLPVTTSAAGKHSACFPKKFPQPVPPEWLKNRKNHLELALELVGAGKTKLELPIDEGQPPKRKRDDDGDDNSKKSRVEV